MAESQQEQSKSNNTWIIRSLIISVAMFGFGYALVPLYDLFCNITGVGGRSSTDLVGDYQNVVVDETRSITLEFTANSITTLPWTFEPLVKEVVLHPGEKYLVEYRVQNKANRDTVGRAIPSIVPSKSAKHLKKTECFCFDYQPVAANETVVMPVVFYIHPDVPKEVKEMTLSYTFFDAAQYAPKKALENSTTQVQ